MKIRYVQVSTQEQNTIRQEVLMQSLGVDQLYIDRASGKTRTGRSCGGCSPMCVRAIS